MSEREDRENLEREIEIHNERLWELQAHDITEYTIAEQEIHELEIKAMLERRLKKLGNLAQTEIEYGEAA